MRAREVLHLQESREKMKLARFAMVLASFLVILSGCQLFNAINLTWSIDTVTSYATLPPYTHVTYTVRNMGKYDLTGVNLQIGVDVYGNKTYPASAWTPDFSIGQNQTLFGSIDIVTPVVATGWATVISVDMDKPQG